MIVKMSGKDVVLGHRIEVATTFAERGRGLLGRTGLTEGEGLWIKRCNSIHMFGMRFPIDVAFVDKRGSVVKMLHGIRPGRMSGIYFKAKDALELPAGTLRRCGVQIGDLLEMM